MMRVERIDTIEALESLQPQWRTLQDQATTQIPYQSCGWITSHLEYGLSRRDRWICYCAVDGSELRGLIPIVVMPHRILGNALPWLGLSRDWHTTSNDFLVDPGMADDVIRSLLGAIREEQLCLRLTLKRIEGRSPTLDVLRRGVTGWSAVVDYDGDGFHLPVCGEFTTYVSGLSQKFRANLRNARNRLNRHRDVRFEFKSGLEVEERDMADFLGVEGSGWKGQSASAISSSADRLAMYRAIFRRLSLSGELEMYFLRVGDRTAAGMMAVRMSRTLALCKVGYAETMAGCSPGVLLFHEIFRREFERGEVAEIDCLTDMPYLQRWNVRARPYYNVQLFPTQPASTLFGYAPARAIQAARATPAIAGVVRSAKRVLRRKPKDGDSACSSILAPATVPASRADDS